MRIAVFGDIHGNAPALRAVLDAVREEQVDAICVTGDFVGYYYWPAEVLDLVIPLGAHCVRGNHEDMLFRAIEDDAFLEECTRRYGSGLGLAIAALSPPQKEFLRSLPQSATIQAGGRKILLGHGTPEDTNEYLYPSAAAEKKEDIVPAGVDLVCLGHTHYRMVCEVGARKIINPGSVGQPRDRIPGAAWALVDLDTFDVELRNAAYDVRLVAAEARTRDPGLPYLAEILSRT